MRFEFVEEPWLYRKMQWSLEGGGGRYVVLHWPSNITADEMKFAKEVIELQIGSIMRAGDKRTVELRDKHAPMFAEPEDNVK